MTAEQSAAAMGDRAGQALRTTGLPTPNPFRGKSPGLAAAWRRAYLTASRGSGRPPAGR